MPYTLNYDSHLRVMFETWTGEVTLDDVMASIERRRALAEYTPVTPRLMDLSGATGLIPTEIMQKLAAIHRSSEYRGRCAIVARSDVQFGYSRMFRAMLGESRELEIFRTRRDALGWLSPGSVEDVG